MIDRLPSLLAHPTPIHHYDTPFSHVIQGQNLP